jgi:hypothetical protein
MAAIPLKADSWTNIGLSGSSWPVAAASGLKKIVVQTSALRRTGHFETCSHLDKRKILTQIPVKRGFLFEFVTVMVSTILALRQGHLLRNTLCVARTSKHVKPYLPHTLWSFVVLSRRDKPLVVIVGPARH